MSRKPRNTYLGGQQMAAVVGMHPYQSIGDVYAACALGKVAEGMSDAEVNADPTRPNVLRRGQICEPGVIDYIEQVVLGYPPGKLIRNVFVQDPDVPFFAGTIDALELDGEGNVVHIHEVTVTSTRAVDKWGVDGDPGGCAKYKWIQNQHYQGITGAKGGTIWLFVSDTGELRHYPAERKNDAIERIRNDGEQFWLEHVLPKRPPPVDCEGIGAWAVAEASIDAMYAIEDGGKMSSTPALVEAANDYAVAREEVKAAEERKRGSAAKIKNALGNHTSTKWDGGRVSWKRNWPRSKTDYEGVLRSLVESGVADQNQVDEAIAQNTVLKEQPRILRVTIKPPEAKEVEE